MYTDDLMERLYCSCDKVEITKEGIDVKVKKNVKDVKRYISELIELVPVNEMEDYKVIIDSKLKRIEIWKDKQWIALYKIPTIENICILETIQKEIPSLKEYWR